MLLTSDTSVCICVCVHVCVCVCDNVTFLSLMRYSLSLLQYHTATMLPVNVSRGLQLCLMRK